MDFDIIDGILTLSLDMIETVALASLVLFLGYFLIRKWKVLYRFAIPAPVVGGLTFATFTFIFRQTGLFAFQLDTILLSPFLIAFFTSIGLGASFSLLKVGGRQIIFFWVLASFLAIFQNVVGVFMAMLMGVNPLLGLIAGSVTMTGGHGTGLAFGPVFEILGMKGATTCCMASATFGLIAGGLIGGPVGIYLINKKMLENHENKIPLNKGVTAESTDKMATEKEEVGLSAYQFLKYMTIILLCMWLGSIVSQGFESRGITLPAYIGAMLIAAALRNLFDYSKTLKISQSYVELFGSIALSLFLSMALMNLKLWELLDLAAPMLIILFIQVTLMALYAIFITFRFMGRDYDAAVMASGHCGFGLGATPTAIANMRALVEKFGPASRAFLVIPIVGAFFVDFSNAIIITFFTNVLK